MYFLFVPFTFNAYGITSNQINGETRVFPSRKEKNAGWKECSIRMQKLFDICPALGKGVFALKTLLMSIGIDDKQIPASYN